ncbi:Nucleolin 2 [Platanthera zijinensis]|uniref:Nucleolin 2 n=1 Tax=Platanthera zijinensis TaxID=2320716 RepID=A0AAP0ASD0_9ASPA
MGKSSKMPKLEVDSPPPSVPETKKVKNGKRCSNESLDKEVSSKKEKKEVEQVGFNKEKAQKLNKISMDPLGQKEEENRNLDFEKVAEAPIIVLSTKGAKIGKRGNENVPEKQARSKKQKIEAESSSQSYKKAKKMKRILVEPLKEEDESISSDFDEEHKAPASRLELSDTRRLFVGNLSTDVIMDDLFEFFKEAGEVIEVQLAAKKDGSFLGFGRVEFSTGTDAQRALGMNGQLFLGRRLMADLELESKGAQDSNYFMYVKSFGKSLEDQPKAAANLIEKSDTKRLFVGNLPSELIKDDLVEFFKKAGDVIEVQLAAKEDGSFRGFGHVKFATVADTQRALEMNDQMFLGRRLIVDLALERGSTDPSERKGAKDSGHWVFVKGFGKRLEEDQIRSLLKEHFGPCGEIIRVSIPQDNKTGHSKGFAFLLFNDHTTVSKALEFNGTELGKYTLTVKESTPKSGTHESAYGGGRGSRGRSGDWGGGRGKDGKAHGIGRRAPGGPYDRSVTTVSQAKKTTFDDDN